MQAWNIAHRGGAQLWPENTPPAFGEAVALGADGAELDVQLSADGQVVVYHDYRINPGYARLRGGSWLEGETPWVRNLTLEQLYRYNIGLARPGSTYERDHPKLRNADGAGIPTLETVIRIVEIMPDFRLLVELKSGGDDGPDPHILADAAYDVVDRRDFLDRTIFVGFDWRALARIIEKGASCWFTTDKLSGDAKPAIDAIVQAGGQGWFTNFPDATPDNVAYARSRGLKVGAWTVNDPADMRRLMGLDAICTDRPDLVFDITLQE